MPSLPGLSINTALLKVVALTALPFSYEAIGHGQCSNFQLAGSPSHTN